MCIEWWSFEIAQFLAGLMGQVQLATQLITLQVASFAFMVPLGISIGAGQVQSATMAASLATSPCVLQLPLSEWATT